MRSNSPLMESLENIRLRSTRLNAMEHPNPHFLRKKARTYSQCPCKLWSRAVELILQQIEVLRPFDNSPYEQRLLSLAYHLPSPLHKFQKQVEKHCPLYTPTILEVFLRTIKRRYSSTKLWPCYPQYSYMHKPLLNSNRRSIRHWLCQCHRNEKSFTSLSEEAIFFHSWVRDWEEMDSI